MLYILTGPGIRQSVELRARRPEFDSRQGQEIFLYSTMFRPALGPTQPPIQWLPGFLSPGVKLTTNLHLVLRSRMVELYLHSPIRLHSIVLK
jgi:hypothetical protein